MVPCVVSYRNSTSNHNIASIGFFSSAVVSYRNSTSNHNIASIGFFSSAVVSYRNSTSNHNSFGDFHHFRFVVSYRNSTSNHNILILRSVSIMLYLIEILHQTTTIRNIYQIGKSCILSKFYIKPQLGGKI